jgi:2-polyprenyl-3-methyl-5-hydroxy-6-metoxy-1,4-benzoquinol methylase
VSDPWDINAAYWDERMGDEGNDWHLMLVRPAVERLLGPVAALRVLDVACGNGLFARRLAKLEADVVATDASERMLDHARRRTAGDQRIEYRQLDVTDAVSLLELGEDAFDAAVCNMALMDIPDITPLAAALPRLLRPGAPFVFSTTHPCFNRLGVRLVAEREEIAGEIVERNGVLVSRYLTPETGEGAAIAGQPANQLYHERPLSQLLGTFFGAGLVLDAIEEPGFPDDGTRRPDWGSLPEIPPVLAGRLRAPVRLAPPPSR